MKNIIFVIQLILLPCFGKTAFGETAQEYYTRGEFFYQQGNYESAWNSLNKAIETGRQSGQLHPRAHLLRGIIYQDEYKNYRWAVRDYQAYLTQPDQDKNIALKRLATAYFDLGMLYRSLFNTAVNMEVDYYTYKLELATLLPDAVTPDEIPYLRYARGLCYYLSGRFDASIADLKQIAKQAPIYHLAQLKLAACYYRIGQTKGAEQIFAQVQRGTGQSQSVLLNSDLWRTYLELGKLEQIEGALQTCEKAVAYFSARQPKEIIPLNRAGRNLSYVLYTKGESEGALAQLEKLDLKVPDFVITISDELLKKHLKISKSTDLSAVPAQADQAVSRTVEISYYDPSLFHQQSQIYFQLAHKKYTELLPSDSQQMKQHTKLQIGLCYLHTNQLEAAIPIFEAIRTEAVDNLLKARAAIDLGVATYLRERESGQTKAQQIWDDVLKKFPGDKDVQSEMAYYWAELGINLPELLSVIRQQSAFTRQMGYVYLQLGIHEENADQRNRYLNSAIDSFGKNRPAVDYLFDDPILLVDLAQSYYHKRYFDESARIWQNFFREYPEVIQIFKGLQITSEISTGVWPLGQMPNPQWVNLNYGIR